MRLGLIEILLAVSCSSLLVAQETAPPQETHSTSQPSSPSSQPVKPSTPNPSSPSLPPNGQPNTGHRIAPGSVIPVQLTKNLDAKKMKTGDRIEAKVTEDLKAGNGDVVVPKGTIVEGRIVEAQARSKEQRESQVGIVFDRAVMKSGDVALPMSVQAIISQSYLSGGTSGAGADTAGQSAAASTASSNGMPAASPGRSGMGTPQVPAPASANGPTEADSGKDTARPPITGQTQGVLGYPDLTLSPGSTPAQGSVVSSEKNNVKLDSGTMLLLRVNQ